jgi:hypothetical protein
MTEGIIVNKDEFDAVLHRIARSKPTTLEQSKAVAKMKQIGPVKRGPKKSPARRQPSGDVSHR